MIRRTEQRKAIREALESSGRPLDPQELLELGRRAVPTLGMATVYRAIREGVDQGWIEIVSLPGEPPRYEPAGREHHHHFRCRTCERLFEVPHCEVDTDAVDLPGFRVDGHEVVLYGRCADCAG